MLTSGKREFLKWFAIVAMLIDHVGVFFFPDVIILRLIGRVAFPLFAVLIGQGVSTTSNIDRYFWRLFFLAVISQVPFSLVYSDFHFNVLFTFSAAVFLALNFRIRRFMLLSALWCVIPVEYGLLGFLLSVWCIHFASQYRFLMLGIIIFAFASIYTIGVMQIFAVLTIFVVHFALDVPRFGRYWAYAVFPVHYAIIAFLISVEWW